MKIVEKKVEMLAWFTKDGITSPIRFRLLEENSTLNVINVNKIIFREKEKIAGKDAIVFNCQSSIDGIDKLYQLKYEINTRAWILFKI
jgi:hypothetical protein